MLTTTHDDQDDPPDPVPVLHLDTIDLSPLSGAPVTDADRRAPLRPQNTAYVMFTSGSTGRPKGVTVAHSAIVNEVPWVVEAFDHRAGDRLLQSNAVTFDASILDLFAPLQSGLRGLGRARRPTRPRLPRRTHPGTEGHSRRDRCRRY